MDNYYDEEKMEHNEAVKKAVIWSIIISFVGIGLWIFLTVKFDTLVILPIFAAVAACGLLACNVARDYRPEKRLAPKAFTYFGLAASAVQIVIYIMKFAGAGEGLVRVLGNILEGAVLLALGVFFLRFTSIEKNLKLTHCTVEVEAVCTGHRERTSGDRNNNETTTYAPIFEYELYGKPQRYDEEWYTSYPKPPVGTQVTLMIDPDDPNEAYRDNSSKKLLFLILGVISVVIGVIWMI